MIRLFPDEEISLKLYCPQCGELLPAGTERCKYCYEEIDEERGEFNTAIHYILTSAIKFANNIGTNDPAVFFYIGVTFLSLWLKWGLKDEGLYFVWVLLEIYNSLWLGAAIIIIIWLFSYGRFNIIDDEYEQKKKEMKQSLIMWLAAYVFHYFIVFSII